METVAIVKRSYEAFARDDLDAVLADLDPQIEWQQAQGLPHGVDAVRRNIFEPLDELRENDDLRNAYLGR